MASMTRDQQKKYISDLCGKIGRNLPSDVDRGIIPESWDGNELRMWIARKTALATCNSIIVREPRSKRAKEYRQIVERLEEAGG